MIIYLVVIADRHTDDGYEAFSVPEDAMTNAVRRTAKMETQYDAAAVVLPRPSDPWIYHASLEDVGSVTVVKVELQ